MSTKKLWGWLIAVIGLSFAVLIFYGTEIYRNVPPIPEKIVLQDGTTIATKSEIQDGQNAWQSIGGQTVGSIWGHGAYIAPDWTADYLHRESEMLLELYAERDGKVYKNLPEEEQLRYQLLVKKELRKNTLSADNSTITISAERAAVWAKLADYYTKLFMGDDSMKATREAYAIQKGAVKDSVRMSQMTKFFAWSTWVCVTDRPGDEGISYTNNWPHDPTVGNIAPSSLHLWSGFSILLLLVGVALLVFHHARQKDDEHPEVLPTADPLRGLKPTASMRATLKYVWIVGALMLVQLGVGAITAHYGVEGGAFYGINLDGIMPQALSRSWHVQLAIFWIATSWLATGLYIAPAVSGHEPKFQALGVNVLFSALVAVVVGSLIGQWFSIMQKLGLTDSFLWGHQGYEYVELGRVWQVLVLVALIIWLVLMTRALLPALRKKDESRHLLTLFLVSTVAIAMFYGAGLMYGQRSHMAIVEYWRWWVVHLWVEGFFEVFATVVAAFLFTRLGLLKLKSATTSVLFATIVFLGGGILGTFHHLYFSATPTAVLALGATFSALEIVPLVLIGIEAYQNYQISKSAEWVRAYKWPIYCFIAVSFWNFLGAGIFGFAINPPIALYYIQGLNTTAVHGHAALFGVYGILGIGLMLFMLRGLYPERHWNDKLIGSAFWCINIGLFVMVTISVLPVGILQAIASIDHGYWYARSAEFMQQDIMQTLRWLRAPGDTLLAIGEVLLVVFIIGLQFGWSQKEER